MIFPTNPTPGVTEYTDPQTGITYVYQADTIWSIKADDVTDAVVSDQVISPDGFADGKRWFDPESGIAAIKVTDDTGDEAWLQDGQGVLPSTLKAWTTPPTAPGDPGELGQVSHDATRFYVYGPDNLWFAVLKDGTFV